MILVLWIGPKCCQGGEGVKNPENLAEVIYERPLICQELSSWVKGKILQGDPEGLGLGLVDLIWGVPRAGGLLL